MIVGLLKKSSPALMSFREACDEKSKKDLSGLTAVRDDMEEGALRPFEMTRRKESIPK